jgi:hypothetical protein
LIGHGPHVVEGDGGPKSRIGSARGDRLTFPEERGRKGELGSSRATSSRRDGQPRQHRRTRGQCWSDW